MDGSSRGVTELSGKAYKVVLPRLIDLVTDAMTLQQQVRKTNLREVDFLVVDATDAFWTIPLDPAERKYFVSRVNGMYLVYLRTAQSVQRRTTQLSDVIRVGLPMRPEHTVREVGQRCHADNLVAGIC